MAIRRKILFARRSSAESEEQNKIKEADDVLLEDIECFVYIYKFMPVAFSLEGRYRLHADIIFLVTELVIESTEAWRIWIKV